MNLAENPARCLGARVGVAIKPFARGREWVSHACGKLSVDSLSPPWKGVEEEASPRCRAETQAPQTRRSVGRYQE